MARTRYSYRSLEDFVTANELTVDGVLDDGWGAPLSVKGREIDATVLFADISGFSERTQDMSPVETLAYVNTFFTWMTAEALNEGPGIIDKYIGDEMMVVFSKEFGSEDPVHDAVSAATHMCLNDVLDFRPHIGIASGRVIVGYAGTPMRHNCSVFGAPVALAARCAGIPAEVEDGIASHTITVPADMIGDRTVADFIKPKRYRDPESGKIEEDDWNVQSWKLTEPFTKDLKGIGTVTLRQLNDPLSLRINNFTVEDRIRDAAESLRMTNRHWPAGRHPKAP